MEEKLDICCELGMHYGVWPGTLYNEPDAVVLDVWVRTNKLRAAWAREDGEG